MATSNAATNYLERRILDFIFKNNALSFASPGDSIYVGLATAVSAAETGSLTEATFTNYARNKLQQQTGQLLGMIRLIRKQRRMQQI
jgi:hypothetical protein